MAMQSVCVRTCIHQQICKRSQYHTQLRLFASRIKISSLKEEKVDYLPVNDFGVPLISDKLRSRIFSKSKSKILNNKAIDQAKSELTKFGLIEGSSDFSQTSSLPDVTPYLPHIENNNISDHLWRVASDQVRPYTDLLLGLLSSSTPPRPSSWSLQPGWTRYCHDTGQVTSVPHPLENCMVFDVEVAVTEDPRAVMAVALTSKAWYSWLSPQLLHGQSFPPGSKTPCSMIPLGSDRNPKLVIGHNIAYDRVRVGDEYQLDVTGTRYLDTMSLHIAIAGMTSQQRLVWQAAKNCTEEELKHKPRWLKKTSMNSLAEVYKFYCGSEKSLDKDVRNSFVTLSMAELSRDVDTLLSYCAGDVSATMDITRVLYPLYTEHCPHPATLAGMLTMSTTILPTSNCWDRFLTTADQTYDKLQLEMRDLVKSEAEMALMMIMDFSYKQDPWLWDMEWKIGSQRNIKGRRMKTVHDESSDLGQLFEDGFPTWYQDLADEKDGVTFVNLSTSKRVVPKLLRLTWKGYPLHHDKVEKWGYLIPTADAQDVLRSIEMGEIETDFPLKQFLDVVDGNIMSSGSKNNSIDTDKILDEVTDLSHEEDIDSVPAKPKKPAKKLHKKTDEVGIDIGLPGVRFCGLPHKNGPKYRVGNPLAKDFMNFVSEGGELASYKEELAEKLLKINMCLSYWRSSRGRIFEQVKVDLDKDNLPEQVTNSSEFDPEDNYGVIIPSLVVAGTITRRAVEKTWLTASNAKVDRIGSELKCYIRAPPGYHFVGADVDSQELWLASILGDAQVGDHGATPLGWMCLQGDKSQGTDLHSKTASAAQVSRDQAKILNYGRIYGAGEPFARLLLMQFNNSLSEKEAASRAKHMYQQTKGNRGHLLNTRGRWVYDNFGHLTNIVNRTNHYIGQSLNSGEMSSLANVMAVVLKLVRLEETDLHKYYKSQRFSLTEVGEELLQLTESHNVTEVDVKQIVKLIEYLQSKKRKVYDKIKSDYETKESLVERVVWSGGSESATFNRLEEIAMNLHPVTPVLKAEISRALDTRLCGRNFLTSRINWVVQSSAVDFLHLLLVTIDWLFKDMGVRARFVISIHDEIRYLVVSEDRYKASLALHLANLLVRSEVCSKLGLNSLPASTAFFSSVDVDKVLRKEPGADCVTPSNSLGLEKGHGIPRGESLNIWQTLDRIGK